MIRQESDTVQDVIENNEVDIKMLPLFPRMAITKRIQVESKLSKNHKNTILFRIRLTSMGHF